MGGTAGRSPDGCCWGAGGKGTGEGTSGEVCRPSCSLSLLVVIFSKSFFFYFPLAVAGHGWDTLGDGSATAKGWGRSWQGCGVPAARGGRVGGGKTPYLY